MTQSFHLVSLLTIKWGQRSHSVPLFLWLAAFKGRSVVGLESSTLLGQDARRRVSDARASQRCPEAAAESKNGRHQSRLPGQPQHPQPGCQRQTHKVHSQTFPLVVLVDCKHLHYYSRYISKSCERAPKNFMGDI